MIERWHRALKTAIRCYQTQDWCEVLPSVLLGLRSTYKEDLKSTPAEMLYGTSLRLPGEFFGCQQTTYIESDFVKGLRRSMAKVASTAASGHDDIKGFLQPNIKTATHVYIRNDAVKSPLQQPYEGPYEVLERSEKYFKVKLHNRAAKISIDRLKTAFLHKDDSSKSTATTLPGTDDPQQHPPPSPMKTRTSKQQPSWTTRSGRRVRIPNRYQ